MNDRWRQWKLFVRWWKLLSLLFQVSLVRISHGVISEMQATFESYSNSIQGVPTKFSSFLFRNKFCVYKVFIRVSSDILLYSSRQENSIGRYFRLSFTKFKIMKFVDWLKSLKKLHLKQAIRRLTFSFKILKLGEAHPIRAPEFLLTPKKTLYPKFQQFQ